MDLARRHERSDRIIPMESCGGDAINGDQRIQVGNRHQMHPLCRAWRANSNFMTRYIELAGGYLTSLSAQGLVRKT